MPADASVVKYIGEMPGQTGLRRELLRAFSILPWIVKLKGGSDGRHRHVMPHGSSVLWKPFGNTVH